VISSLALMLVGTLAATPCESGDSKDAANWMCKAQ
jgi:hypothetical protein